MNCSILDIGSNTVQLSLYQCQGRSFQCLLNRWETVGLMGYVEHGVLKEAGIQALCRVLREFQSLLNGLGGSSLYAFATASLRNISNTEAVLKTIQADTGLAVVVLTGEAEARYSFQGALLHSSDTTGLMVDIGGGSTELVAYHEGEILVAHSYSLGALSLFQQFVEEIFPTAQEHGAIQTHIMDKLAYAQAVIGPCAHVIGVGGTARAVVKLCNTLARRDASQDTVSAEEVHALLDTLITGGKESLRLVLRSAPERIHTLVPGLLILDAILCLAHAEYVTVSETGLREGYLVGKVLCEGTLQ